VYASAKCSLMVARGKQDMLNVGVAGALAGSIGALRTRNPHQIAMSAVLAAGLMMVVESTSSGGTKQSQPPSSSTPAV
jgi:hypothetical protein